MKKQLLTLSALALSLYASADPITLGKARSVALQLVPATAEARLVKAAGLTVAQLKRAPLADSAQKPYYIFSRGSGNGYVIVSGDDCLPEILGYTESGDFDEATCAPQLLEWLDGYAQLITKAQESGQNAPRKSAWRKATTTASRQDIAALCQTHWHQSSPYNDQCPYLTGTTNRALTGCVATAASQVVFYHKGSLPDTLQYDTPTYGYGDAPVTTSFKAGTPLKWGLMQNSYNSQPSEYKEAVATFVAALGAQTWLTYGSSTSGQISNLVYTFSHQFNLSSTCIYKSGYGQSAWEQLIYDDLAAGKPIVYSGVHPSSGGHAVVLDGYQKSTGLFHFNFGWGGQSDGWYTVDDETGMNGFNGQQGMVYKITPTRPDVSARFARLGTFATGKANAVGVNLTNNSKTDFSGLVLYANQTGDAPSSTASSNGTNNDVVAAGATASAVLSFTPKSDGTWYLFLADKNRRILASTTVEAVAKECNVELRSIKVNASADAFKAADGTAYPIIYNAKKVMVTMAVNNPSEVDFKTTVKLDFAVSSDGGATFESKGTKSVNVEVAAGDDAVIDFNISNGTSTPLSADSLYRIKLSDSPLLSTVDATITATGDDCEALFTLRPATLAATLEADSTLKFTGDWDAATFTSLTGRRANAKAKWYDLTEVTHVAQVPAIDDKPNALVYVGDDTNVTGNNVVNAQGVAKSLSLTTGYDFVPRGAFKADAITIATDFKEGQWNTFTSPASFEVPQGVYARNVDGHTSSNITGKVSDVSYFEAGKSYLVMLASDMYTAFEGHDAEVAVAPNENTDTTFVGTFVNTVLPAKGYILNVATNFFESADSGTVVPALGAYFVKKGSWLSSRFTANASLALDTTYVNLSDAIVYARNVIDEYEDIVTSEATDSLLSTIADAELVFGQRTVSSRTELAGYTDKLLAQVAAYKLSLLPGLTGLYEDFTSMIVNPSFESGTSLKGWTKGGTSVKATKTSVLLNTAVGTDGDYLLYCSASSESGTDVKQTVSGLLAGTYTLTAMVGTKDDNVVTVYAGDKEVNVPAHAFGQYYLSEAKLEGLEVGTEGTLEIGIKPCKWYKADAFKLYCTATAADASGIAEVNADGNGAGKLPYAFRVDNGQLTVTAQAPSVVTIHNLQGQTVCHLKVDGTARIQLPSGIYVMGGKKIVVR